MAAFNIVGIDLKLWLGQKLAVVIQQKRLADLIPISLLRTFFDQDLALKHPNRPVFEHFFKHLTAFAPLGRVGDKDGVVVMKRPVAHGSARDMCLGVMACKSDHGLVARQGAIGGEGERFKQRLCRKMGENMGDGVAGQIAALGADVMKAGRGGKINF